ncbi:hypothetical protein CHUAL_004893 [Chamberlinius hualienensis]
MAEESNASCKFRVRITYEELEKIVEGDGESIKEEASSLSSEARAKVALRTKRPDQQLYKPKRLQATSESNHDVSELDSSLPSIPVRQTNKPKSVGTDEIGKSEGAAKSKNLSSKSRRSSSPHSYNKSPANKKSTNAKPKPLLNVSKRDVHSPNEIEYPRVESIEFVNSRIQTADISKKLESMTVNHTETSPSEKSSNGHRSEEQQLNINRRKVSDSSGNCETSEKSMIQMRSFSQNQVVEDKKYEHEVYRDVNVAIIVSNVETSDDIAAKGIDNATLEPASEKSEAETPKKSYISRILDWSADVDDELEMSDTLSESTTVPHNNSFLDSLDSECAESIPKVKEESKNTKHSNKRNRVAVKRNSRGSNNTRSNERVKLPESSTSDRGVSTDNKTHQGGILRVDLNSSPSVPLSRHYNLKTSPEDRVWSGRQLFDPNNPEKPLCVVSPASHLASDRKSYTCSTISPPFQRPSRPHVPYTSMSPQPFLIPNNRMMFSDEMGQSFGMPMVPSIRSPVYYNNFPGSPDEYYGRSSPYNMNATEKNIHEAMMLETQLNIMLNHMFTEMDLKKLDQCRWKIQLRYEKTILSDMEFSTKHNLEQSLWKSAFYQVIENFRRQMVEEPSSSERIRRAMLNIIDEGSVFYENLLEKLQETYGFHLSNFLDSNALRPTSLSRSVKLALLSAQKVTICLGDLFRYREQAADGNNYGKARSWYLKAQRLAPKNGRPYNQLAILAVYARRKLDAVYYYMRSLSASNPFQSAKEGLINIFDDVRKKYEKCSNEKSTSCRIDGSRRRKSIESKKRAETKRGVSEVWFYPDGQVVNRDDIANEESSSSSESDEKQIRNMEPLDLSKAFSLSFLHVHGKLFSRVGMETFTEACIKMFRELRHLLKWHPSLLNSQRLVQIATINMFAIDNARREGTEVMMESHCQPVIQSKALEVGVEIFRIIVSRCVEILEENSDTALHLNEDLSNLLPAVKVWCDWLLCHPSIWNPLPSLTDYGMGSDNKDVWTCLASLLNLLKRFDQMESLLPNGGVRDGCEHVILPEDTSLAGFVPLLILPQETMFCRASLDKGYAISMFRVKRILYCGEFLCGIRPAVLDYNVETKSYVPLINDSSDPPRTVIQEVATENDSNESVVDSLEEPSEDWDTDDQLDTNANATRNLRSRKQQLEKMKAHKEQQQRQIQAVLQEVSESRDVRYEVHPKWLVPDTNCFIDHLTDIQKLVQTTQFHLVVPLVVINELEGLARNLRNYTNVNSHSYKVGQEAQKALKCLTDWTSRRNLYVRAITAKGSLLDTIAFRSETDSCDKSSTNDDIILTCCMHLCDADSGRGKSMVENKRKDKGDFILIRRDVVLLTDDRNLRVKAHAQEVPVKDIPRFMSLMNLK